MPDPVLQQLNFFTAFADVEFGKPKYQPPNVFHAYSRGVDLRPTFQADNAFKPTQESIVGTFQPPNEFSVRTKRRRFRDGSFQPPNEFRPRKKTAQQNRIPVKKPPPPRNKKNKKKKNEQPTINLAVFAKAAYNDEEVPPGYTLVSKQDGISVFQDTVSYVANEYRSIGGATTHTRPVLIIAHAGTEKRWADFVADVKLALGIRDSMFDKRRADTQVIAAKFKTRYPDSDIYLTGHSLGGSTANYAMFDPEVNAHIKRADVYNMGTSPVDRAEVAPKTISHQQVGDLVSVFQDPSERHINADSLIAFARLEAAGFVDGILSAHSINSYQ